jgi:hypothetical protein
LQVEMRNDGAIDLPQRGTRLNLVFEADRAMILADETVAGRTP